MLSIIRPFLNYPRWHSQHQTSKLSTSNIHSTPLFIPPPHTHNYSRTHPDVESHLTYADCCAEMAKKFLIGSLQGQFIDAMDKLSRHIFPIAFSNQFQDPGTANSNLFDRIGERTNISNGHNVSDAVYDNTYVMRPSDFRLKSIVWRAMACERSEQRRRNDDDGNGDNDADADEKETRAVGPTVQSKSICTQFERLLAEFNGIIEWYFRMVTCHFASVKRANICYGLYF